MFGLLRPKTAELSRKERTGFQSAYCNLCGSVAAGYGVSVRLLVLYDFASLAWLLEGDAAERPPFPRFNCVRGGVRAARKAIRPQDQFLAAASVYTCGVKVRDDLEDEDRLRSRLAQGYYRASFQQARADLERLGLDVNQLENMLARQAEIERSGESRFAVASQPSGAAYALVVRHWAQLSSCRIPVETVDKLGDCLGRCVYLIDAFRDCREDLGVRYNPLCYENGQPVAQITDARKQALIRYVVELVRGMDVESQWATSANYVRWVALRDRLLRLLGVSPQSVTLNAVCGVPCGDGFVACDDNDCGSLVGSCCCLCLCVSCCMENACG